MASSSRDAVVGAFRHSTAHHVPMEMRLSPAVTAELQAHLGPIQPEEHFGYDFRLVGYDGALARHERAGALAGFLAPRAHLPLSELDLWGTGRTFAPLADAHRSDLDRFPWPELSAERFFASVPARVSALHDRGLAAVSQYECGSFEQAYALRGYERFMVDLVENPGFAHALLERVAAVKAAIAAQYARAGVDVVWIGDDMGSQRGLMVSLETWREFFKPPLASIVGAIRRERRDVLVAYHSCGHVAPIVPELIEVGIDVLESVQPETMDVYALKRLYGRDLAFWGTVGVQSTLFSGTERHVRELVRERIEVMGEGGGFLIAPAHTVEPGTPWRNVVAFADAVREYGRRG